LAPGMPKPTITGIYVDRKIPRRSQEGRQGRRPGVGSGAGPSQTQVLQPAEPCPIAPPHEVPGPKQPHALPHRLPPRTCLLPACRATPACRPLPPATTPAWLRVLLACCYCHLAHLPTCHAHTHHLPPPAWVHTMGGLPAWIHLDLVLIKLIQNQAYEPVRT